MGQSRFSMRVRLAALALPLAPLAGVLPTPFATRAQTGNPFVNVPVTGTGSDGETFEGELDIKRFVAKKQQLFALTRLSGTLYDAAGTEIGSVHRAARFEIANIDAEGGGARRGAVGAQQVCQILDLTLGPLDLNLLGLRIQLNRVELDITAIPGGGLLGDLLCAIANLLNGGGALRQVARLLNRILRILGGL